MALTYAFHKARRIIGDFEKADQREAIQLCAQIQQAETLLRKSAAKNLDHCIDACQGFCCRNVHLNDIIGVADLVYLLMVAGEMAPAMEKAVAQSDPIFPRDCIFLEDGIGPCVFPMHARPEVCLTTFCSRTAALVAVIRQVKREFAKLLLLSNPRKLTRRLYEKWYDLHPLGAFTIL